MNARAAMRGGGGLLLLYLLCLSVGGNKGVLLYSTLVLHLDVGDSYLTAINKEFAKGGSLLRGDTKGSADVGGDRRAVGEVGENGGHNALILFLSLGLSILTLVVTSVKLVDFALCESLDVLCDIGVGDDCIVKLSVSHSDFLLSPFGEFGSLDYIYIIPQKWEFVKRFLKSFSKNFWWVIVVRGFCLGGPFPPPLWVVSLTS